MLKLAEEIKTEVEEIDLCHIETVRYALEEIFLNSPSEQLLEDLQQQQKLQLTENNDDYRDDDSNGNGSIVKPCPSPKPNNNGAGETRKQISTPL